MRFLGYKSIRGTEYNLAPESSYIDSPWLRNDVDGRPLTLIADIEAEDWEEVRPIWEAVTNGYRDVFAEPLVTIKPQQPVGAIPQELALDEDTHPVPLYELPQYGVDHSHAHDLKHYFRRHHA